MNPGELNKRLDFYQKSIENGQEVIQPVFNVWGKKIVKSKRRDNEQNEESYNFIIRQRSDVAEYMMFQCDDIWYDVLTVEPYQKEKGYLLLTCEKAKIHSFYDTVTVTRTEWVETDWGEDVEQKVIVYENIPCELIKVDTTSMTKTQQQFDIKVKYTLHLETKYILKTGDQLDITHMQNKYTAYVEDIFRYHTYQEVTIRMEGEA
jgi:head-tail adaptor